MSFFAGLSLVCASTLVYEIVLTRILSVVCWYYLAFVAVSTAMFGMTAGALAVQLRPRYFTDEDAPRRIGQAVLWMAISLPISLMTMLAVPLELSYAAQTLYSFLLLSAVISTPFFFSGIAVCLSLTKSQFAIGRIYFADLLGASAGCLLATGLLMVIDGPSAMLAVSAVLFVSASLYFRYAKDYKLSRRSALAACGMLVAAGLNASTLHGIQPIWAKGHVDHRRGLLAEKWNPISKVRAKEKAWVGASYWGPSPLAPQPLVEQIGLDIDSDAFTPITRYESDYKKYDYLRYDVTSIAAQLRAGGSAAVIGVGGGRDVLNCALNGFRRIVGIEVNSAVVDLTTRRFADFSGLNRIPGLEIHVDEGRSYLTRAGEHFDMIQASLVDTWAATSAGAMTLSENALYTVDGWRVFYEHLKPGGLITFSRWYKPGLNTSETYRLFSVAWAMLLSEGVKEPSTHLALIRSGTVVTLLASSLPFSPVDLQKLRQIVKDMQFEFLYLAPDPPAAPELRRISAARSLAELAALRGRYDVDYSPTFDTAPYFFNAVHLRSIPQLLASGGMEANLRAILFIFVFLIAAIILVSVAILWPAWRLSKVQAGGTKPPVAGIIYFIAIGLGFLLAEMAMIQQLAIFLGHPNYSLVVVLGGLILATGIGSLTSDKWSVQSALMSRVPAVAVTLALLAYATVVIPVMRAFTGGVLWQRVVVSLLLIAPCGFFMGFCFPIGMRRLTVLKQEKHLPWMWALNGAAGALGSFVAILVSMEMSIATCIMFGAACYLLAAIAIPAAAPVCREQSA